MSLYQMKSFAAISENHSSSAEPHPKFLITNVSVN